MKSLLMVLMLLSAQVSLAAPSPEKAEENIQTCTFDAGETGKLKFRGESQEVAFERTTKACLQARIAQYHALRGSAPTTERTILFAEDCVNKTYCKR